MKNVHLLATDKPSRLFDFMTALVLTDKVSPNDSGTNHHIYITSSDEEIKEGDWVIDKNGLLAKVITELTWHFINSKKIILTTDQDLISDGVQPIDDGFLEWFVKNSSCEWVEINKTLGCIDLDAICDFGDKVCPNQPYCLKNRYQIMISQEELKHPKVFSENGNELFFDEQGNLIREEPKLKLINKDVHEHYCSLELLQLLYDKGMRYREWVENNRVQNSLSEQRFNEGDVSYQKDTVTHQIVVEWLRVNFGIWVHVDTHEFGKWHFESIEEYPNINVNGKFSIEEFNSPKEATEAGILYVLNNLI